MKAIISLAASAMVALAAGTAVAQENVELEGQSPAICTLPDSWSFVTGFNGASSGTFSGTTWTIPSSVLAGPDAAPVSGGEYAIRIRGTGVCNVSHTIQLKSARGGLTADAASPPPPGFANRGSMRYEAQWSQFPLGSTSNGAFGPQAGFTPTTAGQQSSPAAYVVSASLAPPGERAFDIRMGLQRPGGSQPLLAGAYSDQLTVTLSANP